LLLARTFARAAELRSLPSSRLGKPCKSRRRAGEGLHPRAEALELARLERRASVARAQVALGDLPSERGRMEALSLEVGEVLERGARRRAGVAGLRERELERAVEAHRVLGLDLGPAPPE